MAARPVDPFGFIRSRGQKARAIVVMVEVTVRSRTRVDNVSIGLFGGTDGGIAHRVTATCSLKQDE